MKICENFNLLNYNAYRLTAYCAKAFFPDTEDELIELLRKKNHAPIIILGNGNNVILSKEFYDEHFIILNGCFNQFEIYGTEIIAQAGATMLELSETALKHNLSGFEIFFDIPSSVGGAVVMNAGAGGEEIKDLLVKASYFDFADMQAKEIICKEIGFAYRNSFFQKHTGKLVLKAWFRLTPGNTETIKAKMENTKQIRWSKQPRDYPNCGSVFKRPPGHFVGTMIDELGLKGLTIGGAKISEKHSGFIVNTGNAKGQDILSLIQVVQDKVKVKFGVELEVEQKVI